MKEELIRNGFEPIKGNENYLINRGGIIYNIDKQKYVNRPMGGDYVVVRVNKKSFSLHVLVATQFLENPENKPLVNHIDTNKKNNNVDNLEWATNAENSAHAHKFYKENRHIYDRALSVEEAAEIYDYLKSAGKNARSKTNEKFNLREAAIWKMLYKINYKPKNTQPCFDCISPEIFRMYSGIYPIGKKIKVCGWMGKTKGNAGRLRALNLKFPFDATFEPYMGKMHICINGAEKSYHTIRTFYYSSHD